MDFERGILFLQDSKTGKKPVYLSAAALAILAALPRVGGNPHIIAGAKDGAPRSDLKKPWAAVTKAAGLEGVRLQTCAIPSPASARAHLWDSRSSASCGPPQAATTARYAHLDADPMRRAVDTIGATITAAMDGKRAATLCLWGRAARMDDDERKALGWLLGRGIETETVRTADGRRLEQHIGEMDGRATLVKSCVGKEY